MIKKIDKLEASKSFLGTSLSDEIHSNATHIIGFCFDGTTSYRPGARFGPDGTRDGSFGIESDYFIILYVIILIIL